MCTGTLSDFASKAAPEWCYATWLCFRFWRGWCRVSPASTEVLIDQLHLAMSRGPCHVVACYVISTRSILVGAWQALTHMLVLSLASTVTQYMISYTIKRPSSCQRSECFCLSSLAGILHHVAALC